MPTSFLEDWTPEDYHTLERGVILAKHSLNQDGMFSDENLAIILDEHPDDHLTISTMGDDPGVFAWIEGDRNGVSGAEIIRLVREGKLWLNLRRVLEFQSSIAKAVNEMYDELESKSLGFQARDRTANLLLSSSKAMVHYHVDMPVNMLWHIRGSKRVWVYPHFDNRFAAESVLEKVCAGVLSEDIPYDSSFDPYALVFDVQPGQLITWPQLTPHRVQNLDGMCVSLSTEHKNTRAKRRINVYEANHWLRTNLGWGYSHSRVDGFNAHLKQILSRSVRMARRVMHGPAKQQFVYNRAFKIDPLSQTCITMLDAPNNIPAELQSV